MAIQWGLLGGNNALAAFNYGAQLGQQVTDRREAREHRNALLGMRQQELDAETAQRQAQAAREQQEQRRADLPMLGRLLDYAQDEQTYQQARGVAQQYGIDVSEIPPAYDPAWVAERRQLVKTLGSPQGQQALSNAGKQAMDLGYQPGTPEFAAVTQQLVEAALAQPYTGAQGETRLYTPQIGMGGQVQGGIQGPQPGMVEDGYRFKGGNPADPNSWEPVTGDAGGNASGGFRP